MGYLVLDIEGDGGNTEFKALAPNDAVQVVPGSGPESIPELQLVRSWLYLVGKRPSAVSDLAAIGAETTKLVLHVIDPTSGDDGRVRFIMLEGSTTYVRRLDGSDSHAMTTAPSYIDAWRASDGTLDRIDDARPFDSDTTPGSEGIIDLIDGVREDYGVP